MVAMEIVERHGELSSQSNSCQGLKRLFYYGNSMYPTLQVPDVIFVKEVLDTPVRRGDILVFQRSDQEKMTVHRIESIEPDGLVMKGDNNSQVDDRKVLPMEIIGLAVEAERRGRRRRLPGGYAGLIQARLVQVRKRMRRMLSRVLGPSYRRLARAGLFRVVLPRGWQPRVVHMRRAKNDELVILMGSRAVGRYRPFSGGWIIEPPFKLFVDEHALGRAVDRVVSVHHLERAETGKRK